MAELSARKGTVDRDTKAKLEQWLKAELGATFEVGDGIRTGNQSGAQLTMDDGSILALEEDTLIRFLDRAPGSGEQALDLQLGSASLEASDDGAVLKTLFGQARLEGGTKVQLQRSGDGFRFRIKVGSATLEGEDGEKLEVKAGQTIEITMGGAVMEVIEEDQVKEAEPAEEADVPSGPISATVSGTTVRMKGPGAGEFKDLAAGDTTLSAGTTLEVGAGSGVAVTQGKNKAQLAAGGTYVVGAGDQLVSATSGSVEVASAGKVEIKVPGGIIVTSGGSSTITALGDDGTKVKANSGAVTLKGKTEETITSGQEGVLSLDGDVSVTGRGLSYADVETSVGENLVVHDPRPPTAVRFNFGEECETGSGTIRLKGTKKSVPQDNFATGEGSVSLLLGPGKTSYSLHCIDEGGKEGPAKQSSQVTVLQDAGSRPVPKKAPSTFVEVNGRAYTVLYQNQLPQVTFRWSKAPAGVPLKLHVRGAGRSRTMSTTGNTYSFRSGALSEGTHTVYFDGGGRVSRQTSVTILFDNATPTASLSTPALSGKAGSDVTLAGTALPGWDVEVDGRSIGQDAGSRFSVKTKVPEDGRPVSVRLTHPTRGTHIYLRRTAAK